MVGGWGYWVWVGLEYRVDWYGIQIDWDGVWMGRGYWIQVGLGDWILGW